MDDNRGEIQPKFWMDSTDMLSFFHKAVKEAQKKQSIQLSENVEFYLIQLLCSFVRAHEGSSIENCLVTLLQKAIDSMPSEQIILYKRIADTSLYFCGFCQEYFTNKSFDIKYYISIGEFAYMSLSNLMNGKNTHHATMSKIYKEMSENFLRSIDILLCIYESIDTTKHSRSTLSIYDAWLHTDSKKLEKDLLDRGIIPMPQILKKMQ